MAQFFGYGHGGGGAAAAGAAQHQGQGFVLHGGGQLLGQLGQRYVARVGNMACGEFGSFAHVNDGGLFTVHQMHRLGGRDGGGARLARQRRNKQHGAGDERHQYQQPVGKNEVHFVFLFRAALCKKAASGQKNESPKGAARGGGKAGDSKMPPFFFQPFPFPAAQPAIAMHKLVLIRHGESTWNLENRFTGWTDVDLTPKGIEQARQAGRLLKEEGYEFDLACTSVLKRAIHTLWHCLDAMDRQWLPVIKSWRLNERHYGALQGLNKADMARQYGDEQVLIWRRSYDVPPPAMREDDPHREGSDARYAALQPGEVPLTECLKDTVARVLPYWEGELAPRIRQGQRLLVSAHGNSIRALVKHLDGISDAGIVALNIPNGIPLVYELDDDLKPLSHYYLGDAQAAEQAAAAVASQGKA